MSSALPYDVERLSEECEKILTHGLSSLDRYFIPKYAHDFWKAIAIPDPKVREVRRTNLKPMIEEAIRQTMKETERETYTTFTGEAIPKDRMVAFILKNKIRDALKQEATSFLRIYFASPEGVTEQILLEDIKLEEVIEQSKVFHCC